MIILSNWAVVEILDFLLLVPADNVARDRNHSPGDRDVPM
jgi:hypothetical protein